MSSLRDRIAASGGYKTERVHIPEWDVDVDVRSITVKQHSELLRDCVDGAKVDMGRMYPSLLILSVFDPENGEPAFSDDDMDMIGGLPAGVVERLGFASMRVSGIDQGALESGKGGS